MIIIWGISVEKQPLDNLKEKISRQEVPLGFVHLTRSYMSPETPFHFILNGVYGGMHSSNSMLFNSTLHKFESALPGQPEISEKPRDDRQQSLPGIFLFHPWKLSPDCFFYCVFFFKFFFLVFYLV